MATGTELEKGVRALLQTAYDGRHFTAVACRVVHRGSLVVDLAFGELARLDDDGDEIPAADRQPVTPGTLYDLASVTKVFSAHTVLALVEQGVLALDRPLAADIPAYDVPGRDTVTLRHLLTHTSGLPATWAGWREPMERALEAHRAAGGGRLVESPLADRRAELIEELFATPLEAPPGTRFEYACTGYNTAMALTERVTGRPWADLVEELTLRALGIPDATFRPDVARTAATEYEPDIDRGVVRGVVHDETAWALGGACGNAGLFGTIDTVTAMSEAIRGGASRILGEAMWENQLPAVLGREVADPVAKPFGVSLGLRIGETNWMGAPGIHSRGHTGFTGTSLQMDRHEDVSIVLLTNRVHPTRDGDGVHPLRRKVATFVLERL